MIGLAILGLIAFVSCQDDYSTRWDWTESGAHSLSEQTRSILAGLEAPVTVTGVFQAGLAEPAKALLDRYVFVDPDAFSYEIVDPRQPTRLAALGIEGDRVGAGLLHVAIGVESVEVTEISEEALTNALVKLTRLEQKKIYLLDGHNEAPIDPRRPPSRSVGVGAANSRSRPTRSAARCTSSRPRRRGCSSSPPGGFP